MPKEKLWTHSFIALIATNGFLFTGFHFLLPTITLYVASLGATGTEIGLVGGVFGYSAIFIRLFTDAGVRTLGKKNCLYAGLFLSILATLSYYHYNSINAVIAARILHGFGFGLSTTFAAAIAADIIPATRRGEGIGYFGLGSTIMMAIAPAIGLTLLSTAGAMALFYVSASVSLLAILTAKLCHTKQPAPNPPAAVSHSSIRNRICEQDTGLPSVLTILFGAAYGSVNAYIAMLATEVGIPNAGMFFVTGTIFIFTSRPFGGRLLDKHGPFAVIMPGSILFLAALILIISSHSLTVLLAASIFYGLGAGLLLPALLTWILNVVQPDRRSSASATFYNMLDIGTSTGLLVLGVIAGKIGYNHMYWFVIGIMVLFAAICFVQHYVQPAKTKSLQ